MTAPRAVARGTRSVLLAARAAATRLRQIIRIGQRQSLTYPVRRSLARVPLAGVSLLCDRSACLPWIVSQRYLGNAEEVMAKLAGEPVRCQHKQFGDLTAVWSMVQRLNLVGVVAPCSKAAFAGWWASTAGPQRVTLPSTALDHRRFWKAMDRLDGTDLRTKANQKRGDPRLVGLGVAITSDGGAAPPRVPRLSRRPSGWHPVQHCRRQLVSRYHRVTVRGSWQSTRTATTRSMPSSVPV